MDNDIIPELDKKEWEDINSNGGTIGTGINRAIHKLVHSIVNTRLTISSQLSNLQSRIDNLNKNIEEANRSSSELSSSLNRLTLWGVIITGTGIVFAMVQFLYENKIWPFITH